MTFIRPMPTGKKIAVTHAVRLAKDNGWLIEGATGQLYAAGRVASILTRNNYIVNVEAESGSLWGGVLDALKALGRISDEDISKHRATLKEINARRKEKQDREYVERICKDHGWSIVAHASHASDAALSGIQSVEGE